MKEKRKEEESEIRPADKYRGVAINDSDKNEVNTRLTEQDTRQLNNNPRNHELEGQ